MFTEFAPIQKSLFNERVSSFLGVICLGSFALWAMMIMWNITSGDNPIDHAIAGAIERSILNDE
ncbi:MAG: hypothetical protein V4436_02900 [Patescibacteria group bacterium]